MGSVLASGASAAVAVFTLILLEQCNVGYYVCMIISDLEIQSIFNFTLDASS